MLVIMLPRVLLGASPLTAALVFCLALLLAACVADETPNVDATPSAAPTEMAPPTPTSTPGATPTPTWAPGSYVGHIAPPEIGASVPTLEKRIFYSDAVVWASLLWVDISRFRFRAVEYLKGSGPAEFYVNTHPQSGRNTTWDNRQAVLFLEETSGAAASAANAPKDFTFTTSANPLNADAYEIDTLNPVWLPAASAPGAAGGTGMTGAMQFMAGPSSTTITLNGLRAEIAALQAELDLGNAYVTCIEGRIQAEEFYRDWEAYHRQPWTPELRVQPPSHRETQGGNSRELLQMAERFV